MAQLSTYPTRTLAKVAGVDSTGRVGLSPKVEFNVLDYLSSTQLADVTSFTGAVDVTAAITSAIAAIPSTGGTLYFPAGKYKTTGGFTFSMPVTVRGDGKGRQSINDPTIGITTITCGTDAVNVFTFNSDGLIKDLSIVDTIVATRTSGDAILIYNAVTEFTRVDVIGCMTYGFWNGINARVSCAAHFTNNEIQSSLNYGIILDNEINPDVGDNFVCGNGIFPSYTGKTALAAIRVRSGGNRILSNSVVKNGGTLTYGIYADVRDGTSQLIVMGNKVETVADNCLRIIYAGGGPSHLNYVSVTSNMFSTTSVTAGAIYFDKIGVFTVGNNTFAGGGAYAIDQAGNHAAGAILPNGSNGFTGNFDPVSILTNNTKVYWDANPLYVGSNTASGVSLTANSGNLSVRTGDNVGPTEVSALKFLATGSTSGRPSDTDVSFVKGYCSKTSGNGMTFSSSGSNYGVISMHASDGWILGASTNGLSGTLTNTALRWTDNGNLVTGGSAALATNATNGHLYIPTCAGTPTGTPTAYTGKVAMVYDTTNNKFYIYNGGWKGGTTPGAFT